MSEWTAQSAADLGRGIAAGKIDPVELTEVFLDAIAAHPLSDRIYARVTADRARAEARAARDRARSGLRRSPLDGVPVSWKDLFDTAGTATEAGSALLKGRVPDTDAEVLRTATAMGLVCLGKTHLSELAFSGLGLNPITATAPNVNDPEGAPGGSSSGAAASVAFGLAAAAVGSDTGGSVRIPAAWNDLVGLKTTAGRLSLQGAVPLCESFDTVGPLTRTVEDAGLMLAALEGTKPADLRGETGLKGRRIAVLTTIAQDDLRDAPAQAFADTQDKLRAAGATLIPFEFAPLAEIMGDSAILYTAEAWAHWREAITAEGDKMFAPIRARFEGGATANASDYIAAWQRLRRVRAAWHAAVAGFDAVLLPSAANLPPKVDRLMELGDYYVTENLLTLRNTRIGNLLGLSAITLPIGHPSCGAMLMGAPMAEAQLLRLAVGAEAALR